MLGQLHLSMLLLVTGTGTVFPIFAWNCVPIMYSELPMPQVMFQHIEGSLFCQSLYGHYLLPNGKLAHFVLGDIIRKGHQVCFDIRFFIGPLSSYL